MWTNQSGQIVAAGDAYTAPDGTSYPPNFPKADIPGLTPYTPPAPTQTELDAALAQAKADKNNLINLWRANANQTTFTHLGKVIACDALSRSDIDGVAGNIALTGAFPGGFPNAWKAVDNSYLVLPDVAAFKAMYASMTLQGASNFSHSQALKATMAAATTVDQVNAIEW